MKSHTLPAPVLVTSQASFETFIEALRVETAIAVDTESNSLFAYRERVCLIQFSTSHADYILDPLRFNNLDALGPIFSDPSIQKVFHAAEYDFVCLKREYGFTFAGLFDTMVAARTLGWQRPGLASILEERMGVHISKKYQRANWGARPLRKEMLDYAQKDTHYLLELRDLVLTELVAAGREQEAFEEFERIARFESEPAVVDENAFWGVKGANALAAVEAAVLRELYLYREKEAERLNRPRFKIIEDQTLVQLAISKPRELSELKKFHGMTPAQIRRHGESLLSAIQTGLNAPTPQRVRYKKLPTSVRNRYERLQQWRKEKGKARGVEPDIILPRKALWDLAHRAPRNHEELDLLEQLGARRRELYGKELLELLHSKDPLLS